MPNSLRSRRLCGEHMSAHCAGLKLYVAATRLNRGYMAAACGHAGYPHFIWVLLLISKCGGKWGLHPIPRCLVSGHIKDK